MNEQAGVIDTTFNILVKLVSKASRVDWADVNVVDTVHDIFHAFLG